MTDGGFDGMREVLRRRIIDACDVPAIPDLVFLDAVIRPLEYCDCLFDHIVSLGAAPGADELSPSPHLPHPPPPC